MTAQLPDHRSPDRPAPRLDMKVGFSCNNACVFCVQGDKRERHEDRSFEEICALLAKHRKDTDGVVLTGGEATIRADIIDIVREARDLGFRTIQIQTNGRRLSYKPFVRALAEAGATEVSPALHGSQPSIHDGLTRARGAWNQVVKGIRHCRAAGLPIISNSVVVKDNYRDLPALADLLARLGVQQMQFAYVHPAGTAETYFDHVVARFEDAVPWVRAALDVARKAGVPAVTEAIPYCFMQGYEEHVVEDNIPDTCVVDAELVIDDYTEYRWTEGKAKGAPCAECTWSTRCEGPWHEYPRDFGWAEFIPRKDTPPER